MDDRQLNILLVEDDTVDVMTVKRAFAKGNIGSHLFVASDGVEALEALRSGVIPGARRLILLDLNMPRMNGIEFLQELRADPALSNTPVVVLTTSNDEQDKARAHRFHVAGYLLKPVTFASFLELMVALTRYWSMAEMPELRRVGGPGVACQKGVLRMGPDGGSERDGAVRAGGVAR